LHLSDGNTTLARVTDGTQVELQYADALQNLMLALDAQGNVTASFQYGAFGEIVAASGAADHRRQFNGKEHDESTGLRYYGYRYYDPLTLRWNSADPLYRVLPELGLSSPQRMNLYTFSVNNPMRYYDPDGRDVNWDTGVIVDSSPGGGPYCNPTRFGTHYCSNDGPSDENDTGESGSSDSATGDGATTGQPSGDAPICDDSSGVLVCTQADYFDAEASFLTYTYDLSKKEGELTLAQASVSGGIGKVELFSGPASVTFKALAAGASVAWTGEKLKLEAGIEAGTVEACVDECFFETTCVKVCGSLGPQLKAGIEISEEKRGVVWGAGVTGATVTQYHPKLLLEDVIPRFSHR
jgi:RHS repeat-associated protein